MNTESVNEDKPSAIPRSEMETHPALDADHAPRHLKLWICSHCLSPRLYGSGTDCLVCGSLNRVTAEYVRADLVTTYQ